MTLSSPDTTSVAWEPDLQAMLRRLEVSGLARVRFKQVAANAAGDRYRIRQNGEGVTIEASSAPAAGRAVLMWLRDRYNASLEWNGFRWDTQPNPGSGDLEAQTPFALRHYLNQCTFGYSTAFWDWERWEREIDWMVLRGVNLPLMMLGQEAIWHELWLELGVTEKTLEDFWVGPAYLPWQRMGLIDHWCGPLPRRWLSRRRALAQRVLERMRSLGMTPVLPAFAGHVPGALRDLYPNANIQQLKGWHGFDATSYLDPRDPLFARIAQRFIELQKSHFSSDGYYAADPFIEVPPPTQDEDELRALSEGMINAMRKADPDAVWVMQGWPFAYMPEVWTAPRLEAFLNGLPSDGVLLLDLWGDVREVWRESEAFVHRPWCWCVVENFGGRSGMHGKVDRVHDATRQALSDPARGKLTGLGMCWEGVGGDDASAEFFWDCGWQQEAIDIDQWVHRYVRRRYGVDDPQAQQAWQILRCTLLSASTQTLETPKPVFCLRPRFVSEPLRVAYFGAGQTSRIAEAAHHLLAASGACGHVDAYLHDLATMGLNALAARSHDVAEHLEEAFFAQDRDRVEKAGQAMLNILEHAETIAATRGEMLLGRWIREARAWGEDEEEAGRLEASARRLLTTWGGPTLHDYACRMWSGLFSSFYHDRWQRFVDALTTYVEHPHDFHLDQFQRDLAEWEQQWPTKSFEFPSEPEGDTIRVVRNMFSDISPIEIDPGI